MKSRIFASLLMACLPWLVMAQNNDDLYYMPTKEKKAEVKTTPKQVRTTNVYAAPGATVVVKDASGKTRDVDEYNRRYTARENTFSKQNDTLYIQEKPYGEQGEWVNGFSGSQDDYEYAMRIVRFRSPGYAIPVSSPLYWEVVYGAYPSWNWNVYDDGLYAYIFPTYSNPLWWDWRWNWSISGPRWGFGWSWGPSWYYSSWYYPYWYGGYWAGYWGPGWHHHHHPYYGGWGGGGFHWGHNYTYNSRRAEIGLPQRGISSSSRTYGRVVSPYDGNGRTGGRVVGSNRSTGTSVRSGNSSYTRPSRTGESSYSRPSSTRNSSYRNSGAFERTQGSSRDYSNPGGNVSRSNSSRSNFGGSSFRSSGGSSSSRGGGRVSSGGGGAHRR